MKFINQTLEKHDNYKIILFPHAYQDIGTIGILLNKIEDKYKRERIEVAPLFSEAQSFGQIFDLYRICDCVIGMRFHTNVCCIGMNIPTIGLAGHEQISGLYNELGLLDRCIKLDNIHFVSELTNKLNITMKYKDKINEDYKKINKIFNKNTNQYLLEVKKWLDN